MFIVIGANGHVGSAVVSTLLDAGRPVTAVLHSSENDADWRNRGAQTAVVDVHNTHDLRAVFRTGTRAFLLNPNARSVSIVALPCWSRSNEARPRSKSMSARLSPSRAARTPSKQS
jgi:uncharacterized protein YbjT (DUF2867 family)